MTWAKFDDRFWCHPKVVALSDRAFRLYVTSVCWAASQETDGEVPRAMLPVFRGTPAAAAELVRAGLWEAAEGGWRIHDFLDYHPSRAELDAERARRSSVAAAAAKARWQAPADEGGDAPRTSARMRGGMRRASATHATTHASTHADTHASSDASSMHARMHEGMRDASDDASDTHAPMHASDDAGGDASSMPDACVDASTESCSEACVAHASEHRNVDATTRPDIYTRPEDHERALTTFERAHKKRARALAPPSATAAEDELPLEVREIRDTVLLALPERLRRDPGVRSEAEQFARDFAGRHEEVAAAIAACRSAGPGLPFPQRLRQFMPGGSPNARNGRDSRFVDDPILAEWRALGVLDDPDDVGSDAG